MTYVSHGFEDVKILQKSPKKIFLHMVTWNHIMLSSMEQMSYVYHCIT